MQSLVAQTLFYLGDIAARGMEPTVNLDMAKHQIDTLGMLEEKTRGNLTDDEKRALDDVQKVDANFDIDASVMSGLQS